MENKRIKTLDSHLINQIAAGEVVERPASIIKELFENSLDANAKQIVIEISQGGHECIRVIDDGEGINSEDLLLALQRHSTSKIKSAEDLTAIQTLGFRGEALASIAAVSRLKLSARVADANSGFFVLTEGGEIIEAIKPTPLTVGTTIEVRDLFYNTPARRKFLRTPKTEFLQIESTVQRLALSNFQVAIKLMHNQKTILDLPIAETQVAKERRVATILGKEFMQNAISIDFSAAGMQLSGWVVLPTYTRAQADMQYFYLNGRYLRDKILTHAARNAYQDILFHGRHPAYILYFTCDPKTVDVNVHPTKQEVRLRDSRLVHDFIVKAIKDALEQVKPATEKASVKPIETRNYDFVPSQKTTTHFSRPSLSVKEQIATYAALHPTEKEIDERIAQTALIAEEEMQAQLGVAIAQLHDIYILAQNKNGLIIVDMHAAHERILYEKMKRQMAEQGMQTQLLLVPFSLNLAPQEMRQWELHHTFLKNLGFITEASGPNSIILREIPVLLKTSNIQSLLQDLLSDLQTFDSSQRIEDCLNSILGNMACRAAIKAHHKLTIPEMNTLLRDMENTANSGFCNHGRPTWLEWNLAQLDKFFLRGC